MTLSRLSLAAATAAAFTLASLPASAFGPERYDADTLEVENLLGSVEIRVDNDASGITVSADGKDKELLGRLSVRQSGNKVVVDMDMPHGERRSINLDTDDAPKVTVTMPAGSDLRIRDLIGSLEAGSGLDEVRIDLESAATMTFGNVHSLDVDAGGALNLEVGEVEAGVRLRLDGAGNVEIGRVTGPTDLSVSGLSNVEVERVDGPLTMSLDGIGRIAVRGGRSEMVDVDMNGLGSISYDGQADSRRVSKSGMGSVTIAGKDM